MVPALVNDTVPTEFTVADPEDTVTLAGTSGVKPVVYCSATDCDWDVFIFLHPGKEVS